MDFLFENSFKKFKEIKERPLTTKEKIKQTKYFLAIEVNGPAIKNLNELKEKKIKSDKRRAKRN